MGEMSKVDNVQKHNNCINIPTSQILDAAVIELSICGTGSYLGFICGLT
jgi:hypothetical protein